MKELLYLNLDFTKYQNKAKAQVKAFDKLGIRTRIVTIDNDEKNYIFRIYEYNDNRFNILEEKKILDFFKVNQGENSPWVLFKRFKNTMRLYKEFKKNFLAYFNRGEYDYCYIRRIGFFIIFFKHVLKELSKSCDVIYEIPTYPLDKYNSLLVNMAQSLEMFVFNHCLKKYISLIPIMLQNDAKPDKKMVVISNAMDYERFADINEEKPSFDKEFRVIILAHILDWHGYDRFVESLKKYDGDIKIVVDIYSDFNEDTKKLKKLAESYNLTDVHFKGQVQLDDILSDIQKYHVAIGSLGYHRRNGKYDTSIKNKEYCAMGLPFVCSAVDIAFPEGFKYIYYVPANDESFDINGIINWYREINKKDYKTDMRKYASEELTYEKQYKSVFSKL